MPGLALMEDPRQQLAVQQATHYDMNGASSPLGIVTEQVCCPIEQRIPVTNSVCVFKADWLSSADHACDRLRAGCVSWRLTPARAGGTCLSTSARHACACVLDMIMYGNAAPLSAPPLQNMVYTSIQCLSGLL